MSWYLNKALTNFRNEVNLLWPFRDKASDGTIGDKAHQGTNSDHNEDADGSVDAWDMDVEVNGAGKPYATDLQKIIDAALKHESIQYIIYNRKITSRSMPGGLGKWHYYSGSNPHDKHVHFNTRSSHEKSTKPWFENKETNMYSEDKMKAFPWQYNGRGMPGVPTGNSTLWALGTTYSNTEDTLERVKKLEEDVKSLLQTPPGSVIITDEQLERVIRKVLGSVDNV